jgi:cellobiose-specific phosphotransferase system component IIB
LQSEEELQEEIELSTQEIEEIPEEIKVIHIDPQDYGTFKAGSIFATG